MIGGRVPTLLSGIATATAATPDHVAIVDSSRSVTYAELQAEVSAFADTLRAAGSAPQLSGPVSLLVPRSAELAVAALAVIEAGGCIMPVDPRLPHERVRAMTRLARPHLSVSVTGGGALSVHSMDIGGIPVHGERWRPHRDAYVLFTSGSTGEPKGVAMPRSPLEQLVDWHRRNDGSATGGATTQLASAGFDVAWQEVFSTLCTGGTLVVPPDEARVDPCAILQWVTEYDVRRLFLATAMLDPLGRAVRDGAAPTTLRHVFVAGSQLRITPAVREWFARMPECTLHNQYGPTETHVVTDYPLPGPPQEWTDLPPIGEPLDHVRVRVVRKDHHGAGELVLGGHCVSDGYVGRPDLTAERFEDDSEGLWYRTGDLVVEGPPMRFLGRLDRMLKLDGHRVEPGEVEVCLAGHPDVEDVYVDLPPDATVPRLVAYVVPRGASTDTPQKLQATLLTHAASHLPDAAVPRSVVFTDRLPLNDNGKVDGRRLPPALGDRPPLSVGYDPPLGPVEQLLSRVWGDVLDVDPIGRHDPFFEVGGTSLAMLRVAEAVRSQTGRPLPLSDFYAHPTIAAFAARLDGSPGSGTSVAGTNRPLAPTVAELPGPMPAPTTGGRIAVVGMACRFPGGATPREYFARLFSGADLITRWGEDISPDGATLVLAAGVLEGVDEFDAEFFGISTAEAALLDPQHRLFLECCWEALEDAAVVPGEYPGLVGVYGGTGPSTYLLNNLLRSVDSEVHTLISSTREVALLMATDQDFLTSRVSYLLDLRGPSVNVNGACATSVMALHQAVEDLRSGACHLALAGASSVQVPQMSGYERDPALPLSPDGVCRVFDAASSGTVFGSGAGVVALKRLEDAVADRDDIYAVILGSGTANDGRQKVGMTAPSVAGQVRAVRRALDSAGVDPATVSYVEAHGTGTRVGDPIELAALSEAYGSARSRGVGSVKSHVGHLGWAAGMAGLTKAILALRDGVVPATINVSTPNPDLLLEKRRFTVISDPAGWPLGEGPVRIGVNAVGLGGANAHVVLESPPDRPDATTPGVRSTEACRGWYVLPVSGRTEQACRDSLHRLAEELRQRNLPLEDVARTLALGRRHHEVRAAAVVSRTDDVPGVLVDLVDQVSSWPRGRPVVAVFPGHGVERAGQACALYRAEPVFRDALHRFDDVVTAELGLTVPEILYGADEGCRIEDPAQVHAVVFATQVGLFRLLESKGVVPEVLLGHSLGQYAAAAVSGVFDDRDGIRVVIERGRALEDCDPTGTMWSLRCDEAMATQLLGEHGGDVDLAVVNAVDNVIVSGPVKALEDLRPALARRGISVRELGSLRAGHSRSVLPAARRMRDVMSRIALSPPRKTLLCNRSGGLAGVEMADPDYWADHLISTVRFADCVATVQRMNPGPVLQLGISPGVLGLVAAGLDDGGPFVPVLGDPDGERGMLKALAACHTGGTRIDWPAVVADEGRMTHLPTYPFQRQRHWIGPSPLAAPPQPADGLASGATKLVHRISWSVIPAASASGLSALDRVIVLGPDDEAREAVAKALRGPDGAAPDVHAVRDLEELPPDMRPALTVLVPAASSGSDWDRGEAAVEEVAERLRLVASTVRLLDRAPEVASRLCVVTCGAAGVEAGDVIDPVSSAVWAMLRSVALERPEFRLARVDVDALNESSMSQLPGLVLAAGEHALRGGVAYGSAIRRVPDLLGNAENRPADPDEVVIVTGGMGGLGLQVVEHLADMGARKFVLVGRTGPHADVTHRLVPLIEAGVDVVTREVDLGDSHRTERLVAELVPHGQGHVRVVHCAGVLRDALVENVTDEQIDAVLAPKVGGIVNLLRSLKRHEALVSGVLLFSSATATHGNLGQSVYAAANGFLDGLADRSAGKTVPVTSIGWGVWRSVGFVNANPDLLKSLLERGFGTIGPDTGLDIVAAAIRRPGGGAFAVLPNDWAAFRAHHAVEDDSFYDVLSEGDGRAVAEGDGPPKAGGTYLGQAVAGPGDVSPLNVRLREANSRDERVAVLADAVAALASRYVPASVEMTPRTILTDTGIDSLSLVQMRNDLQAALGRRLPARLLATRSTPEDVAIHVVEQGMADGADPEQRPGSQETADGTAAPRPARAPDPARMSVEQKRWLSLVTGAGYGRRAVPVFVHSALDVEALHRAIAIVVERHALLRGYFPQGETCAFVETVHVVPASADLCTDLRGLDVETATRTLASVIDELIGSVPDPRKAPSWAVRAVHVDDHLFLLLLASEHLQFDGTGLSVFVDETRQAYAALLLGADPVLPPVVPYSEYVAAQDAYRGQQLATDRDWFRALFAGVARPTRLDREPPQRVTLARPSRRHTPSEPLHPTWQDVTGQLREKGVSAFGALLASFACLASEVTGDGTVCLSVIRSHRTDGRFARTIGPFTSPIPVPAHVAGFGLTDLVYQLEEVMQGIMDRSLYPVTDLVTSTRVFRSMPEDTYFSDFGLNYTDYRKPDMTAQPRTEVVEVIGKVQHELLRGYDFGGLTRIPGLHLVATTERGALQGNYWYHEERVLAKDVESWAERHRKILDGIVRALGVV